MRTCEVCGCVGTFNWKCKACRKQWWSEYYIANKEKLREKNKHQYKKYYAANLEKLRQKSRAEYHQNPEKAKAAHKRRVAEMSDCYIRWLIRQSGVALDSITEEMVALKRATLMIKRITTVADSILPEPYDNALTGWFVNDVPLRNGWYERISGGKIERDYYSLKEGAWMRNPRVKYRKNLQKLPWRGLRSAHKVCAYCSDTLDLSNFEFRYQYYKRICNSCDEINNAN